MVIVTITLRIDAATVRIETTNLGTETTLGIVTAIQDTKTRIQGESNHCEKELTTDFNPPFRNREGSSVNNCWNRYSVGRNPRFFGPPPCFKKS
jgi:hypothetical protein